MKSSMAPIIQIRFSKRYSRLLGQIFVVMLLSAGFSGCRSSKNLVKRPTASDSKILGNLVNNGDFESIDSKVNFRLTPSEGVSVDTKGSLRMRRDSCLILSIQPFAGIEVLRCLIRKDSIFIVSRLHQVYSAESLKNNNYGQFLKFELLQAILTNKIFIPGQPTPSAKDLNNFEWHEQKGGSYFRWNQDSINLDFYLNDAKQYSKFIAANVNQKIMLEAVYSLFQEGPTGSFPTRLEFSTEGLDKKYRLQITYFKPSFNSNVDYRFEIPSKYKKVSTADLIRRFQTMI
jgi:hypothetical protein